MLGNLWFLNFVHVLSSLLWTGVDLYMGFVLGPILRRLDLSRRGGSAGFLGHGRAMLPALDARPPGR